MTTTSASSVGAEGAIIRLSSGRISQKQRAPSDGTDSSSCSTREPWISTNKILNSSLCGRRINSRNPNFDYDETKLLIALWGDPMVQKTLITTHKKHPVIAELARKMRDQGYNRSTEEINTRIKNLKCFYNRIKKDMAAGIINQTTWRHYAEMDEIISRPVFGNAHRLHMQQQTKQQQQQQQQHQQQDAVAQSSKHENDQEDGAKDALPQFPVKLEVMSDDDDDYEPTEIRAEDLLTIDAKFPDDSPAVPSQRTLRGNRNGGVGSRNGKNVTNGRGDRKQTEEDDDDEEDDEDDEEEEEDDDEGSDFDVENEFNDGLDELLQKAQATKSTPGSSGTTKTTGGAAPKPANTSGLVIETITSGNGTTITATGTSSTSIPTTGKISVVPTNLLMKQPSSVASSLTTPIQIYTQPTVSIAKGVGTGAATAMVATAGTTGTGSGPAVGATPMKLLLVNTVAKDGTTQQILTPAPEASATMPKLIPAPVHHSKIPLSVTGQSPIVTIPTVNVPKKVGEPVRLGTAGARAANGGQSAGFRTLLTQLVAIQRENLALNQERLALEKERLEFEKQFGGSLVGMVRNMSTFFTGMLVQQRKEQQQQLKETQPEPQPSNKSVEPQTKRPEGVNTPPPVATEDRTALEGREISSSASSPLSVSRVASPTSTTKAPATDSGNETKEPTTGSKRPEPSSTPPPLKPAPSSVKPSSTSDVSLPKKRRMMTRNSAQHTQLTGSGGDDPLKTEIISDADDP